MSRLVVAYVACSLTLLETIGTVCLNRWARRGDLMYMCIGILMFSAVGYLLGMGARTLGSMTIVNAVWQSTSIACVTLYCVLVHGEILSRLQLFGVTIAVLSSVCLLVDSNQPPHTPLENEEWRLRDRERTWGDSVLRQWT